MNRYKFNLDKFKQIELEELTEEINTSFQNFYKNYFLNKKLDLGSFWDTTGNFLDVIDAKPIPFAGDVSLESKAAFHDGFFNNFTLAWRNELQIGNYWNALKIWDTALKIVKHWEGLHSNHVHKGTAYFFQSVTCIENEDLDRGFSLMYEGYLEDLFKNNNDDNFDSPGKSFITFNVDNVANFYRSRLLEVKIFLEQTFLNFRRRSPITYDEFINSFFKNSDVTILIKHQFLLNIFRVQKFSKLLPNNPLNSMNGLLYMESVLGFCRLIEPIYTAKFPNAGIPSNKALFEKLCYSRRNIFKVITQQNFNTDVFRKNLQLIVKKKAVIIDGKKYKLSLGTRNILLSYGFRNLTAHELHQEQFIIDNIHEILRAIFYSIYKTTKL